MIGKVNERRQECQIILYMKQGSDASHSPVKTNQDQSAYRQHCNA